MVRTKTAAQHAGAAPVLTRTRTRVPAPAAAAPPPPAAVGAVPATAATAAAAAAAAAAAVAPAGPPDTEDLPPPTLRTATEKRRINKMKRAANRNDRFKNRKGETIRQQATTNWSTTIDPRLRAQQFEQPDNPANIVHPSRHILSDTVLTKETAKHIPQRRQYRQFQRNDPRIVPSVFTAPAANADGSVLPTCDPWRCPLQCIRCIAIKTKGGRCGRRVCVGLPFCPVHMRRELSLSVKPSTIDGIPVGKGVFADRPGLVDNIVFPRGWIIVEYTGERLTNTQLNQRYIGETTAPYAYSNTSHNSQQTLSVDGACVRGIGSLINHHPLASKQNVCLSITNNPDFVGPNGSVGFGSDKWTRGLGGPGPWPLTAPYRMYVLATKDIKDGEELYISYGNNYEFDGLEDADIKTQWRDDDEIVE